MKDESRSAGAVVMTDPGYEEWQTKARQLEIELAEAKRRIRELESGLDSEGRWANHYYQRWLALRDGVDNADGRGLDPDDQRPGGDAPG